MPPVTRRPLLLVWQITVVCAATAYAVLFPLEWVSGPLGGIGTSALRWGLAAVFIADVFVSLVALHRAPIVRSGSVVYEVRQYRRGFLWADVLAAIPVQAIAPGVPFAAFGLLKLVKVGHLLGIWRRRAVRFDSWVLLGYGAYWLALAGHALACGWLAQARPSADLSVGSAYLEALYWTVTTVTGVGYGDIVPTSNGQRAYAALTMLLGFSFFGYVVGVVARVIGRTDPATERFQVGVEALAHATRSGALPKDLEDRVYDYHWYVWKHRLEVHETDWLQALPEPLRAQVSYHLRKDLLDRLGIFSEAGEDFMLDMVLHLKSLVLTPGDVLFDAGDEGEEMYFIAGGSVEVRSREGRVLRVLGEGDFFGEIAAFEGGVRTASVAAVGYCELYSLDRRAIRRLARRHPDVHERIRNRALERTGALPLPESGGRRP